MGTESQLLRFVSTVNYLKKTVAQDQIFVVFFDLKSVFDMVSWNKLFNRLVDYNFGVDIIKALKILFNNMYLSYGSLRDAVKIGKGIP